MAGYVKKLMEGISGRAKGSEHDWLTSANPSDRFYGFENFGNTCYSNSVVQALYYCKPFRDCALHYSHPHSSTKQVVTEENVNLDHIKIERKSDKNAVHTKPSTGPTRPIPANATRSFIGTAGNGNSGLNNIPPTKSMPASATRNLDAPLEGSVQGSILVESSSKKDIDVWNGTNIEFLAASLHLQPSNDTLLDSLQNLFIAISDQKKQVGVIGPKQFITKLKESNEIFASTYQQDAHELFNYLINEVADSLQKQKKDVIDLFRKKGLIRKEKEETKKVHKTWIHELFEGQLTNETKCLNCESVTNRDEPFLDLSVDIDQNTSLSTCLRQFSKSEVLRHKNKFFCDTCNSLQEAEKKMKIKKLPNILAVHLKRFKFQEEVGRFFKLSYRVCFTEKLGVFNTVDETENSERMYNLCAIIVHIGSGPHHGHYVAVVKNNNQWILLDDEDVHPLDESDLYQYFGESNLGTGYLFIYNSDDYSYAPLLKSMMPDGWDPPTSQTPVIPLTISIPGPALHSNQTTDSGVQGSATAMKSSQELRKDVEDTSKSSATPKLMSPASSATSKNQDGKISNTKEKDLNGQFKRPSLPLGLLGEANIVHQNDSTTATCAEFPVATPLTSYLNSKEVSGWSWFKKSNDKSSNPKK